MRLKRKWPKPSSFWRALFVLSPLLSGTLCFASSQGWRLGPGFLIGFPHPIQINADVRPPEQAFSFAGGVGYLPLTFDVGSDKTSVHLKERNIDGRLRFHPMKGAFYLGMIVGRQWISASATKSVDASGVSIPTTINIDLSNFYFTPHLGWQWVFESTGFFLGFDLGWQIGFRPSNSLDVSIQDPAYSGYTALIKSTAGYQELETKVNDGLNKLGTMSLPYVTLLHFGWYF